MVGARGGWWTRGTLAAMVLAGTAACGGSASSSSSGVPVPELVTASSGILADRAEVRWMPGAGQSYEVAVRHGSGGWSTFRTTNSSTFSATYLLSPDVPLGTELAFRVRTNRDGTWSDWSPESRWVRPRGAVVAIPDRDRTGGTVGVRLYAWVSALSPDNPSLELTAGEHRIAVLGPIPWPAEIQWDTTTVPEGTYRIGARLEGGAPATGYDIQSGTPVVVNRAVVPEWTVPGYHHLFTKDAVLRIGVGVTPVMTDAPAPARARLWAGPVLLAEFATPPWPTVEWDTSASPEGDYPIRLEVPNYSDPTPSDALDVVRSFRPLVVHLDRTPPLVRCEPPRLGQAVGWTRGRALFVPDEYVTFGGVLFTDDRSGVGVQGEWRQADVDPSTWPPQIPVAWAAAALPPFRVTASAQAFDNAGWPARTDCTFDAPAWLAPWGEGPLEAGGVPIVATSIALEGRLPVTTPNGLQATIGWIPPDGSPSAGRVRVARGDETGFGPASSLGAADGHATSVALSARVSQADGGGEPWVAWTDASVGSTARPHVARWDGSAWQVDQPGFTASAAGAAREIRIALCPMAEADGVAAWTEVDASGVPTLATRRFVAGSWVDLVGSPIVTLAAGSHAAELATQATWGNRTTGLPSAILAHLQDDPAGVPQVRAAEAFPGTGWILAADVLNRNPASAASEPSAAWEHEGAVTWAEDGKVLVRDTDLFFAGRSYGDPVILNVDPSRRARLPRAARSSPRVFGAGLYEWRAPLTVFFVEEGPTGDEIWARRRHTGTWELLPGPVNAGVPGRVRGLTVVDLGVYDFVSAIAWIDDLGHVHVRVANL